MCTLYTVQVRTRRPDTVVEIFSLHNQDLSLINVEAADMSSLWSFLGLEGLHEGEHGVLEQCPRCQGTLRRLKNRTHLVF